MLPLSVMFILLSIFILGLAIGDKKGQDLLTECQTELPRTEVCVLIAVPKKEG